MNLLCLAAALVFGAPPVADGTLLFLDNSNAFVELYTGSNTTHVAIVLNNDGRPEVYEATPSEVRKLSLEDYYSELGKLNQRRSQDNKIRLRMAQPRVAYTDQQVAAMRKYLNQQVGRRYSIKGYLRGESDGIHCAELASRTLCAASVMEVEHCQSECPATVLEKVQPNSRPLALITLVEPEERDPWCTRRWNDWSAFSGWCQWSCWETLSFCW